MLQVPVLLQHALQVAHAQREVRGQRVHVARVHARPRQRRVGVGQRGVGRGEAARQVVEDGREPVVLVETGALAGRDLRCHHSALRVQKNPRKHGECPHLHRPRQPVLELRHHQALLLAAGHVGLARAHQHAAGLDQLRHLLPVDLDPAGLVQLGALQAGARGQQVRGQRLAFGLADGLAAEVARGDEGGALARVVAVEPQPEQARLEADEAGAQVGRAREGQAQDVVRVVVLLPLRAHDGVRRAGPRRRVGAQRQVLVEQGAEVRGRLGGGSVAEG